MVFTPCWGFSAGTAAAAGKHMAPFFIVGPPKTGTTLLTRLIVQQPQVTCISESYVLEPGRPGSIAHPGGEKWAQHGLSQAQASAWHQAFETMAPAAALRHVLTEAWETMRAQTNSPIVGDSWPFYSLHLPVLAEAFPDAKYIYTTRDPRAVYWSGETYMGRKQGSWNSALLLNMDRRARRFFEKRDVFVVRYEELVQHPEVVLSGLWEYLGADPADGWVDYQADKDPYPERWAWIPNATKPLDPSRCNRWQLEMPAATRRVADLAAAEYANVWDYPVALDEGYAQDEFVDAFIAGASLELLPPDVEDQVRARLSLTQQALKELKANTAPDTQAAMQKSA